MYYSLVGWLDIENDRAIIADRLKSFVLHSVCVGISAYTHIRHMKCDPPPIADNMNLKDD